LTGRHAHSVAFVAFDELAWKTGIGDFGRFLETSVFEFLREVVHVIVTILRVFFFSLNHLLNETRTLNSVLVFLRVFVVDAVGILLHNSALEGNLLVEAEIAVVADVAVEIECASTTKALLHLKSHSVAVGFSSKALDLDNVLLSLSIDNADVPVALFQEIIVLGADEARADLLGKLIVHNLNFECHDVHSGDDSFAFTLDLRIDCH